MYVLDLWNKRDNLEYLSKGVWDKLLKECDFYYFVLKLYSIEEWKKKV